MAAENVVQDDGTVLDEAALAGTDAADAGTEEGAPVEDVIARYGDDPAVLAQRIAELESKATEDEGPPPPDAEGEEELAELSEAELQKLQDRTLETVATWQKQVQEDGVPQGQIEALFKMTKQLAHFAARQAASEVWRAVQRVRERDSIAADPADRTLFLQRLKKATPSEMYEWFKVHRASTTGGNGSRRANTPALNLDRARRAATQKGSIAHVAGGTGGKSRKPKIDPQLQAAQDVFGDVLRP